ncbi:MAG TPA: DUF2027 domain-containing protein [Bacteroidales bacterium]|nr:DUF2027 domain-containing protein [Bacteroidales bacterium]
MKFKPGDKVSFLNDTGGGTINRIDENGRIIVLTGDGFEIPVSAKELVPARNFNYTEREEEEEPEKPLKKLIPAEPKPIRQAVEIKPQIPVNVSFDSVTKLWIGFIAENNGPVFNSNIACYLINDSPYMLYYFAGKKEGGSMYFVSSGTIEPDTKTYLASFDQTLLSKISHLHIQILFVSKGRYIRKSPVDKLLDLNLINFSKESYYRENDYFEEKAVLFGISDKEETIGEVQIDVPEEIIQEKLKVDSPAKPKKKESQPDTLEIDLHYEGGNLNPGAILALQMSRFHSGIEEAISKNLKRIVFIHGLGQGTLKMQIRKEIQEKYPNFIYQDASFKEYGFGATMVHLILDKK